MEEKRKVGRPKKRPVDKRVHTISLKVSVIEFGRLKTAARDKGVPLNKLIRGYLSEYLEE